MPDNKREYRTVIVYGAGHCGKTHHAMDIARALGCNDVCDGWGELPAMNVIQRGALHLTQQRPTPGAVPDFVLILPIEAALAVAFVLGAI